MNTHEQLKEICDKIWYDIWYIGNNMYIKNYKTFFKKVDLKNNIDAIELDVREIIYTTEFMNKYIKFILDKDKIESKITIFLWLMHNLDNSVKYLYNLIK